MINCPKCNEPLGDQVSSCPFCRTTITEDARRKALQDYERAHAASVIAAMEEHSKRKKYEIITCILMFLTALAGTLSVAMFDLHEAYILIIFIGIFVLYVLSVIKFRIGLCPYCEKMTGRGSFFKSYCPRCGGRLR